VSSNWPRNKSLSLLASFPKHSESELSQVTQKGSWHNSASLVGQKAVHGPAMLNKNRARAYQNTGTSGLRRFGGGGGIQELGEIDSAAINDDVEVAGAEDVRSLFSDWEGDALLGVDSGD